MGQIHRDNQKIDHLKAVGRSDLLTLTDISYEVLFTLAIGLAEASEAGIFLPILAGIATRVDVETLLYCRQMPAPDGWTKGGYGRVIKMGLASEEQFQLAKELLNHPRRTMPERLGNLNGSCCIKNFRDIFNS